MSSPRPVLKKTFGAASALEALVEESKKQLLQLNDVKNKLVEELESAHKINRKLGKQIRTKMNVWHLPGQQDQMFALVMSCPRLAHVRM